MTHDETATRLTVTLTRETNLALRAYLGARRGALSGFIESAVRWRMFDQAVQGVKARALNALVLLGP